MDTFTLVIAIIMMMLAIQFNQNWLVVAIATVLILTTRNINVTIFLIIAAGVLYFFGQSMKDLWPFVLFGLVILSIILGIGKKQEQEQYPLDMGMEGGFPPMGMGGY